MQSDMHIGDPGKGTASALRLLIASEVRFLRESLGEVLGRNRAMLVIGDAQDCGQILNSVTNYDPISCCWMRRCAMGLLRFANCERRARCRRSWSSPSPSRSNSVVNWAEAGVAGYIPSNAALADLNALVTNIQAGRQACSQSVSAGLIRRIAATAVSSEGQKLSPAKLTRRELEIVSLIRAGLSNKEISRRLNIGVATTKSHVHNVLNKLNLNRRGQAANWMRTPDF